MDTAISPAEPAAARSHRWRLIWLFSFASWLGVWLLATAQSYIYFRSKALPLPWPKFTVSLYECLFWGLLSPGILWYSWRIPLTGARWRTALPFHILAWLVVCAAFVGPMQMGRLLISRAMAEPDLYQPLTLAVFFRLWVSELFAYIDPFLVAQAVHFARESRAKQLRTSQLEARLAEAQLQVLRMQLHPHFLFNTLHTISALMHKDVRAADRMLALLGDLLRDSFDKIGAQEVSLKQELGFLDRYLEIERTRFRDRLVVETDVDPETLDAEVPNLILQPLVENAIRHGVERRLDAGRIGLSARRAGERLVMKIRDDGPGLPSETELALRGGVGLANTQARLAQLYGPAQRFDLVNRPEGGLEVVLSIPFKLHPPEAAKAGADRGAQAPATPKHVAVAAASVR